MLFRDVTRIQMNYDLERRTLELLLRKITRSILP